ncbi:MAG: NUDIX domain-containing protein [Nocardioides sp.]|nr:NUDIX domain-containing protein [Nocardioides sp.]
MQRFASVALVDPRGWVLLQERDEHPVIDPGRWGFPGGGVEPGESFEQAAYRELAEETGVRLERGLEPVAVHTVFHAHSGSHDELRLFAAATGLGDEDIVCGEGRQMVFVDASLARAFDLTAGAALALPAFLDGPVYRRLLAR